MKVDVTGRLEINTRRLKKEGDVKSKKKKDQWRLKSVEGKWKWEICTFLHDGLKWREENGEPNEEQKARKSVSKRKQQRGLFYLKGWLEMDGNGMTKSM